MAGQAAAAILFPAAGQGRLVPVWTAFAGGKPGEVSRRFHAKLWKPFRIAADRKPAGQKLEMQDFFQAKGRMPPLRPDFSVILSCSFDFIDDAPNKSRPAPPETGDAGRDAP
jgi:hypothetical protein